MRVKRFNFLLKAGYGHHDEREYFANLIGWFDGKSQDYWLFAARQHNWDYGELPFFYMILDDRCDLAVAKEIFWLGSPSYFWTEDTKWGTDFRPEANQRLLLRIIERENRRPFRRSDLRPTSMEGLEVESAAMVNISSLAPKIPASLTAPFVPMKPRIANEDHPTWNPKVANIFSALGS